ncbi:MAG TPA: leucine-rich repeat protein [Gemmataceae bacterium]|nr:leucine-rich repeat protein [Gemmataceae bacterium]
MKMHQALLFLYLTGSLFAADDPKDAAAKKESEKLAGTWKVTKAEHDSQPDKAFVNAVTTFTADGKFTAKFADGMAGAGTYKLDPSKKPKAIEITMNFGPNKGKPHEGIYALEGETLKICSSDPGKPRPKEFATKADSGQTLFVLTRAKAETAKAPAAPPAPPPFADKNLEAAVRAVLQNSLGDLSDANLANVYLLEAAGKQITNLKGLEKCKNLSLLKLTNNQISNLEPLKDLTNLQSLDLAGNKITEIGPLGGLTKLQYLELSHNQVSSLAPLGGLTNLASLYLTDNKIHDVASLGNLTKLASLSLGHNQIQDISPLAKLTKITTLELKENQISDLTPLAKDSELSLLMLERNRITDLTPLVAAAKTDGEGPKRFAPYLRLYVSGNPLSDAARTSQLATLRGYGVRVTD